MIRKSALFAAAFVVLLAFCVSPLAADSATLDGAVSDVEAVEVAAAGDAAPYPALEPVGVGAQRAVGAQPASRLDGMDDVDSGFLLTFDEELDRLLAGTEAGIYCNGWGLIPGCDTNKQCYRRDKCGITGGVCHQNCCICY